MIVKWIVARYLRYNQQSTNTNIYEYQYFTWSNLLISLLVLCLLWWVWWWFTPVYYDTSAMDHSSQETSLIQWTAETPGG